MTLTVKMEYAALHIFSFPGRRYIRPFSENNNKLIRKFVLKGTEITEE